MGSVKDEKEMKPPVRWTPDESYGYLKNNCITQKYLHLNQKLITRLLYFLSVTLLLKYFFSNYPLGNPIF